MVGDINFFLYPLEDDDEDALRAGGDGGQLGLEGEPAPRYCVGEIDVMIAEEKNRGRGLGKVAVSALLHYIQRSLAQILQEYDALREGQLHLKLFMVKIKESNTSSIALFKSLGFQQQGPANHFGEIKLTLGDYSLLASKAPENYVEKIYSRPSQ